MPKKLFNYKTFGTDIWYTDSLKGWFITKEKQGYCIKKGSILNNTTIEFGVKIYKVYQRLGDAKTGLENYLKERSVMIKKQEELFNELQKYKTSVKEDKTLDYTALNKEAERLKEKWGLK